MEHPSPSQAGPEEDNSDHKKRSWMRNYKLGAILTHLDKMSGRSRVRGARVVSGFGGLLVSVKYLNLDGKGKKVTKTVIIYFCVILKSA